MVFRKKHNRIVNNFVYALKSRVANPEQFIMLVR